MSSVQQSAGRFAPSPTGLMHFGTLVAAVASFLQARSRGAPWYVRMEDIDPPRTVAGSAGAILKALEALGLFWDGPVFYQGVREEAYTESLNTLLEAGLAFPCACTRREAHKGPPGIDGPIYPGTCRNGMGAGRKGRSLRLRVDGNQIGFNDQVQGPIAQRLDQSVGDFVLKRADGFYAYQLAVVIDDAYQGIGEVVRGADLLDSTPRQIYLQSCLGLSQPSYLHIPMAVDKDGTKLSKSAGDAAVDTEKPGLQLLKALRFLGQHPPAELNGLSPEEVLNWAIAHWRIDSIPKLRALPIPV